MPELLLSLVVFLISLYLILAAAHTGFLFIALAVLSGVLMLLLSLPYYRR